MDGRNEKENKSKRQVPTAVSHTLGWVLWRMGQLSHHYIFQVLYSIQQPLRVYCSQVQYTRRVRLELRRPNNTTLECFWGESWQWEHPQSSRSPTIMAQKAPLKYNECSVTTEPYSSITLNIFLSVFWSWLNVICWHAHLQIHIPHHYQEMQSENGENSQEKMNGVK